MRMKSIPLAAKPQIGGAAEVVVQEFFRIGTKPHFDTGIQNFDFESSSGKSSISAGSKPFSAWYSIRRPKQSVEVLPGSLVPIFAIHLGNMISRQRHIIPPSRFQYRADRANSRQPVFR